MGWSVGLERAGGQPYRGTEDDDEDEHEHDWGASNAEFGVPRLHLIPARQGRVRNGFRNGAHGVTRPTFGHGGGVKFPDG